MKVALQELSQSSNVLKDGFCLTTRLEAVVEDQYAEDGDIREEFVEDDVYVGQMRGRPLPSFRVGCDLYEGYFVTIRPANGDLASFDCEGVV